MCGRACIPILRTTEPPLPTRIVFCDSVSTIHGCAHDLLVDLLDVGGDRVRHLLAGQEERLLADQLRDLLLDGEIGALVGAGSTAGPRAAGATSSSRSSPIPSPVFALTGWSARKGPSFGGRLHLRRDVARLEAVDLVDDDHDRHAEREDALRDEAVAGADVGAAVDDQHHRVEILERRVDGALHPLGQRVERPLEARQVGEHELVVVAVRDPEDAPPGRLRLVGDDRHLAAADRVHERRLPDVRPAGDRDEARLHYRGRTCPAAARPPCTRRARRRCWRRSRGRP